MISEKKDNYILITYGDVDLRYDFPAKDFSARFPENREIGPDEESFIGVEPYLQQKDDVFCMDYYFAGVNVFADIHVHRFLQRSGHRLNQEEEKKFFTLLNGCMIAYPASKYFVRDIRDKIPRMNMSGYFGYFSPQTESFFLYHAYYAFGCPHQPKGILARTGLIQMAIDLDDYPGLYFVGRTAEEIFDLPLGMLRILEAADKKLRNAVLTSSEMRLWVKEKIRDYLVLYPELENTTLIYYFVLESVMVGKYVKDEKAFRKLLPVYVPPDEEARYIMDQNAMFGFGVDRAPVILEKDESNIERWGPLVEAGYYLVDKIHYIPRRVYDKEYRE